MLELKPKQHQAIQLINTPGIDVLVLIGSVETGKTYLAAHAMVSIADSFAKSFIPVMRLNKTTAKTTVFRTYQRVLDESNYVENRDYRLNRQEGIIKLLHNESEIQLFEADHTKDPDHMKIKGLEANAMHIDEVDELKQTAYEMAQSRVGRDAKHLAPPITVVTMNPNNKWPKAVFYDPWKKGELPSNVAVLEFTRYDSWSDQSRYERFIATRPRSWIERYINNNWDVQDDLHALFKYRHFDAALTLVQPLNALRYIGYDVAVDGDDRSVLALWYGNTLVDIVIVKDTDAVMETDDQALELIKFMQRSGVVKENTSVDAVGVGAGVVGSMKGRGLMPRKFKSGFAASTPEYANLRSEVIAFFARGLEKGTLKIYEGCPFRNELISEAMAHNHSTDKVLTVESKKKIKERTGGMSPDIFDAVVMGLWPQAQQAEGEPSNGFDVVL